MSITLRSSLVLEVEVAIYVNDLVKFTNWWQQQQQQQHHHHHHFFVTTSTLDIALFSIVGHHGARIRWSWLMSITLRSSSVLEIENVTCINGQGHIWDSLIVADVYHVMLQFMCTKYNIELMLMTLDLEIIGLASSFEVYVDHLPIIYLLLYTSAQFAK